MLYNVRIVATYTIHRILISTTSIADRKHAYNNAILFVDSCNSTAQKDRTTGERGPATEL